MATLQSEHPEVHLTTIMDQGEYVGIMIDTIVSNLVIRRAAGHSHSSVLPKRLEAHRHRRRQHRGQCCNCFLC